MPMRVREICDLAAFRDLQPAWQDLVADSSYTAPYYGWHWHWIAWQTYADDRGFATDRELNIMAVENADGQVLAIAPLMCETSRQRRLTIRQLRFLPGLAPRNAILFRNGAARAEVLGALFQHLATRQHDWEALSLINVEDQSTDLAALETACQAHGFAMVKSPAYTTPYIDIGDDFQALLHRVMNRPRRQSIGRKVRRMVERNYRVELFTQPEEMARALELTYAVCRTTWKADIGSDITANERKVRFYHDIAVECAKHGQIRIWVSFLDDQPMAAEYYLTDGKKLYFMMNDFDQQYEKLSPGTVLLYQVVEQAHGEPIDELDFGGPVYGYKMKWATGVREHYSLEIYNRRLYSRLLYQGKTRLMPALRKLLRRKTVAAAAEIPADDDA
jgi:CelD/BcsL family acetyltransferase involved in cellulose biosynthesis